MGNKPLDISGLVVGQVTVLAPTDSKSSKKEIMWECICACGSTFEAVGSALKRGRHRTCSDCKEDKSKLSPYITLYGSYRYNAVQRGHKFDLDFDSFMRLVSLDCEYCGSEPFQTLKKEEAKYGIVYMGIDRVDNTRGYTVDNVVPCCKFCNLAKSRFPVEEFLKWVGNLRCLS